MMRRGLVADHFVRHSVVRVVRQFKVGKKRQENQAFPWLDFV
jgi:hypothetical protein